jgi:hypothetical protein
MNFSKVKAVRIPEGNVKRILSGENLLWAKTHVNRVPISIDTDGSIYNGCGYVDGQRLRSTGALASYHRCSVTGYIPVSPGDVVRMTGWNLSESNAANCVGVFDKSFSILGSFTAQPSKYGIFLDEGGYDAYDYQSVTMANGIYTWTVPPLSTICYIRINGYDSTLTYPSTTMIVTVNQEISI